jgi:hypothetical protein
MINKINKLVAVVFFSAIGMVTAPTIATVSMVYGASFNPLKDIPALKGLNLPVDKEKFNFNIPDIGSSGGSGNTGGGSDKGGSGNTGGGSDKGGSGNTGGSNTGGSNACKVDNSQKGTHFYCATPSGGNSHHHCKPGPDNPGCKKF